MKVTIERCHSSQRLTMAKAVRFCSLDTEEILAKLLEVLIAKDMLTTKELGEIFYWDFSFEEIKEE